MSNQAVYVRKAIITIFVTQGCDLGYVEVEGYCRNVSNCPSDCQICPNSTTCNTCLPGFYRYAYHIVYYCGACQDDCSTCFPKFYKSGSNCLDCPSYCATCTSSTVCQNCEDPYQTIGTICSICDISCKTCQDTSCTCTSCEVGQYLSNSQCLPCSSPCSACINNSNECSSCIDSNKTVNNLQCVCNDEYYSDASNQCQLCITPCSKCVNNPNDCTQCISTFTLSQDTQYKCECQSGYFPQKCQKCLSPCQTCETNQNYCLSCVDRNQAVTSLHQCQCNIGWILNNDGITCIKCELPCLVCVDTITKCITCQELHQQPEICECDSGWIQDEHYFCISCLEPCKTCDISTSKCLTCVDPHHELNQISQCVCKSTYYSDTLTTCVKCIEPCFECDTNGCITCLDINQILDSNKQCVCKSGYLQQGVICLQCKNPCSNCINTVNECLSCIDPNQIIKDYQCLCKVGFVQKGNFCCDKYCIDCEGVDNCNNCMKGFYLSIISRCLQCIDHCDVCFNQINCEICQEEDFISQLSQCEPCIPYCKVCGNSSSCDLCFNGYYLLDQKCESYNQNCETCNESSNKCLTCRSNYEIDPNNQCICKERYYEQQNQCHKCEYPCKKCLSKTICQECELLSNLHLNLKFECNCSSGYFWNQNSCSQCYQSCLTFVNKVFIGFQTIINVSVLKIILKVKIEFAFHARINWENLKKVANIKIAKIQFGLMGKNAMMEIMQIETVVLIVRLIITTLCCNKILKQSIFFQCSTNCIQCLLIPYTNKSQCIKCKAGYFLNKNDCVLCSINCLECIDNAYNCISCKFPQQNNHKCQFCKSGYYADEINGFCHNKCGDYIKINEEECDDGNLIQGDGCDDQCKLEKKFIFLNGVSILPNYPKPLLQSEGTSQVYSAIRLFKLSYTSQIVITDVFQLKIIYPYIFQTIMAFNQQINP
ncbi:unnamed protein product [Paramecium sonneborni]|uniref:EGF-like domain-containing protein n=1 Tax=Paramecium sonneborni TaxID=65129 RepID=A0A8S1RLK3_9CILI|nr:unnamed protein product [Paramecium sonneborni]